MPAVVADLGAVTLYAWPFVAFLASSVFGTVLGGRWCDLPRPAAGAGQLWPLLFGIGLLGGRHVHLDGAAAGRPGAAGRGGRLPDRFGLRAVAWCTRAGARPALFGLMSSAWVLPSLIGPPIAGLVTDPVSWHWVFLGLVPFVVIAVSLVVPAVRRLVPPDRDPGPAHPQHGCVIAALGAAVAVGLSWAAQHVSPGRRGGAAGRRCGAGPGAAPVVAAGVVRVRRGVPTVVTRRGLLAGSFFTVAAYLPLMLDADPPLALTAAGVPLIAVRCAGRWRRPGRDGIPTSPGRACSGSASPCWSSAAPGWCSSRRPGVCPGWQCRW